MIYWRIKDTIYSIENPLELALFMTHFLINDSFFFYNSFMHFIFQMIFTNWIIIKSCHSMWINVLKFQLHVPVCITTHLAVSECLLYKLPKTVILAKNMIVKFVSDYRINSFCLMYSSMFMMTYCLARIVSVQQTDRNQQFFGGKVCRVHALCLILSTALKLTPNYCVYDLEHSTYL